MLTCSSSPISLSCPLRPTRGECSVEVLSPSTARADRQVKRRLYQQERVGEYWIVDVDARIVERWRATDERPEIVSTSLRWHPEPSAAPFELDLPAFFADVLRESLGLPACGSPAG